MNSVIGNSIKIEFYLHLINREHIKLYIYCIYVNIKPRVNEKSVHYLKYMNCLRSIELNLTNV